MSIDFYGRESLWAEVNGPPVGSLINYRLSLHAALMQFDLQFDLMPMKSMGTEPKQILPQSTLQALLSPIQVAGTCSGKMLWGLG